MLVFKSSFKNICLDKEMFFFIALGNAKVMLLNFDGA